MLVGATDIHDYGKEMVKSILNAADAKVFDMGSYVTTDEIIENLLETEAKVVMISTYNGIALTFGSELCRKLSENEMEDVLVIIGGLLNENMDGSQLAVDVTDKMRELGISCANDMGTIVDAVKEHYAKL